MGNNDKLQNRRELRRKRRVRNQIISYVILTVLISAVAAGIVFATGYLLSDSKTTEQEAENKELIDDMLADEESIATPEPVPEETVTPEPAPTPEEKLEELAESVPVEEMVSMDRLQDEVEQEVQEILNKLKLLPEDIKGTSVDQLL